MPDPLKHIFLYGPPGSGKSTVGKVLADALGLAFIDLDSRIESTAGQTIKDIMGTEGELAFRDLETQVLQQIIPEATAVIALGGGALLRPANRTCAENCGEVVVLEAGLPTLVARLSADGDTRPLLAGSLESRLSSLLASRQEHYTSFDLRVANESRHPEDTALAIQGLLGRFHLRQGRQEYDYLIEPGGLSRIGKWVSARNFTPPVVLVTDTNVGPLYASTVQESLRQAGLDSRLVTFPAGEGQKTLDTVSALWHSFIEFGLDRKSLLLALGGGVVGDLAGFTASTYLRGIAWAGLPTSLLAMVDSSLGGKTGFDLPSGKNLVGSFHPPSRVLADPVVLATLPAAEFRSGMGEVMKHGVIADPELFRLGASGLESCQSRLEEMVRRAVAVKLQYIQADPYELGLRAALNYGHTVGHAVELVSGFRLRHGEAVAIGMAVEARLAEHLSIAEKGLAGTIGDGLRSLGLPTDIPAELSPSDILQAMQVDKKKHAGKVRFALPVRIGEVRTGVEVDDMNLVFEEG